MKKVLSFIPLGVGISAAIIYVFNVMQFKVINNSASLFQILSNLKIYLYISIIGFVVYFMIRLLEVLSLRKQEGFEKEENEEYEPFEPVIKDEILDIEKTKGSYIPDYNYVPMYHEDIVELVKEEKEPAKVFEKTEEPKIIINNKYCYKCGNEINDSDNYCSYCGTYQLNDKKKINPMLRNVINVLEIVILILIIYFSLNMLFSYKESTDPNFKSPFNVSMTK